MKCYTPFFASILLSACGQLLLKSGATTAHEELAALNFSFWIIVLTAKETVAGLICWTFSTLIWFGVLAKLPLSYAYCLGSLNYIYIPLAAHRIFRQPLSAAHALGMIFIGVGIALTVYSNQKGIKNALP